MAVENRRISTKREKNFNIIVNDFRRKSGKCKKFYSELEETGKNMKGVRNFTKSVKNNHRSGAFYNVKYHCVIS